MSHRVHTAPRWSRAMGLVVWVAAMVAVVTGGLGYAWIVIAVAAGGMGVASALRLASEPERLPPEVLVVDGRDRDDDGGPPPS